MDYAESNQSVSKIEMPLQWKQIPPGVRAASLHCRGICAFEVMI